jgi:hypothetical protein
MSDNSPSMSDDIAYLRDLAEAGASTPLLSGMALIVIGALFGLTSLAHWALFAFAEPEDWMILALWLSVAAFSAGFTFIWVRTRMLKKPGIGSPTNRAVGWTWNSTGWVINILLAATLILSWRLDSSLPFTVFPSVIAAVYGGAWLVTRRLSGQDWMQWPTFGSFGFALLLSLLITTPYLWLAFSAAFFLNVMIPGIVMVRREPQTVV